MAMGQPTHLAEVVFDEVVADQPGLDRLRVAPQAAAARQDHAGWDVAAMAAVVAVLAVQTADPGHGVSSSARTARSSS
jgi:hypothetical protein